jgi:general stress protein 26
VLVLSWRSAHQRVFAHAIFAGSLLVIADRRFFDRVWAEAGPSWFPLGVSAGIPWSLPRRPC